MKNNKFSKRFALNVTIKSPVLFPKTKGFKLVDSDLKWSSISVRYIYSYIHTEITKIYFKK